MIVINGKTYRNLEEQVQKNKEDIEALEGRTAEVNGTTIAAHTNSTTTIVKHIGDNGNVEYNLATPVVTKIDNSLQLPGTGLGKTELVGIGVNNEQVNVEIDTNTLDITNNRLSVIAGSAGVTKEYVDNGLAGKLDKLENTSDRTECYVNQAGTNRLLNTSTDATRNLIVRWDNGAKLHSNTATAGDEVVNYNQWFAQNNDLKANIDLKANLTANTFTGVQTFSGGIVSTKPATADNELTTLAQMKNSNLGNQNYTDTKFTELNDQLVATNTEVSKKLNKATSTSGSYAYVRNGTKDETIPVNPLVGNDTIVRRTSTGTIKANAGVDDNDCVNKKQLDDAIAGAGGGGVQLNVANTWTALQTFNEGLTTTGTVNIGGQGNININGSITCDGGLTLTGGDILQGGAGNFSSLVTSFGDGGLQFATTNVPLGTYTLFKVTYKYSSRDWTDTYKVTTTKRGYTKTLITNEDIKTSDFTWNTTDNKLELNTRIVSCDQSFYDSLTTKDKNTLYVIVG